MLLEAGGRLCTIAVHTHLHDDASEGFNLLHVACSEPCSLMGVEHDQIDLALDILHQLHQPACA